VDGVDMNPLFSHHVITTTSKGDLGGKTTMNPFILCKEELDEEEFKDPKDYTEEEIAAAVALEACLKYWRLYTKRRCLEDGYNTAVVWVQDNQSGNMAIFTRGEHAQHLKNFVEDLNTLPMR